MYLSKHHYATELAHKGNTVYFLNPPFKGSNKQWFNIVTSTVSSNLHIIDHKLFFPYEIKFHATRLYELLIKFHLKRVLKKLKNKIDIIWSFDLGYNYPLSSFPSSCLKLFHLLDEPRNRFALKSVNGATHLFSVTKEILQFYKDVTLPKYLIPHGLALHFKRDLCLSYIVQSPIQVGYSGNLLRHDIDRPILLQIIQSNPQIQFNFWGSYTAEQSNIGSELNQAAAKFIETLQSLNNVILYGPIEPKLLAKSISQMDLFLICYNINLDQSGGTNYHKIIEYLSTGKVIVANNITAYKDHNELLNMVSERTNNKSLPNLFETTTTNIAYYNSIENQNKRIKYAQNNFYYLHLQSIETYISPLVTR